MFGYVYLLQTRESIKNGENIYKIGRTTQDGLKRFNSYPKGSELILHMKCFDPVVTEKHLIDLFNKHFVKVDLYGNEYFQGDLCEMATLFCNELHLTCHFPDSIDRYNKEILRYKLRLEEADQRFAFYNNTIRKYKNELESLRTQVDNLHKENELLKMRNDELNFIVNSYEISSDSSNNSSQLAQYRTNECSEIDLCHNSDCDVGSNDNCDENGSDHSVVDLTSMLSDHLEHVNKKAKYLPTLPLSSSEDKEFKCSICKDVLSSKRRLEEHQSKCTGLHPLQCVVCLRMFKTAQGKYQHKKYVKCEPSQPPETNEQKYLKIVGKLHC